MPVTAKLSQKFYERLGDDIANELVDWFNQVDATYRNDLRELNEMNFQRFDAKLEQRIAELRSDMNVGFARLETRLTNEFAERFGSQMKWLFTYWVTTLITLGGLIVTLSRLGR